MTLYFVLLVLPTIPELVEEVERGAILTSEIEMLLKLAPCKVIGVTGTEGKTTTTSIIADIIKKAGYNCYLGGNIGKPIFVEIDNIKPEDVIVIELSSFQLMDMDVSPEISIVTNIYPDHLNVHKSYEEYQDAKKNIFKYQTENGLLILNKDNDITYSFSKEANGKVILFSSKEKLENGYIYDRDDETIKFCKDGIRRHILKRTDIKLRGIHNYENICAALAATAPLVSIEKQTEAIKSFNGVEHRLEFVRELDGVKYYNDSIGTSPASTIAGLNAFDENIILLAGGSDKGLDYKEVGENIARKVGILILTGPTAEKIEDATLKAKNGENVKIYHCENLKEAVKKLDNLSEDERMQRIADLRQKAIMDEKAIYEKGLEIGIEKGIQRGMEKGIEKGIMEGSQKEKIEIAKKMLELKIDKKTIAEATGLTEQEIEKILN